MNEEKCRVGIAYLALINERVRSIKERSYALMDLAHAGRVLDVGCGPGTDTIPMALLVGPSGRVVGVDHDPEMIAAAEHLARSEGLARQAAHLRASAYALPFPDGAFDAVRSERLFQHLLEPQKALSEMVRVTRPDGRIVILDTDYGAASVDSDLPDVERRLVRVLPEQLLNNGYVARRLNRLFKEEGLSAVSVEPYPLVVTSYSVFRAVALMARVEQAALDSGVVTPDELRAWREGLERADAAGTFYGTGSMLVVSASRPR